jgi:hypothetical protein
MRRVPPSVIVREELDRLLAEGADQETNIVSALVDTGLARTAHLGDAHADRSLGGAKPTGLVSRPAPPRAAAARPAASPEPLREPSWSLARRSYRPRPPR